MGVCHIRGEGRDFFRKAHGVLDHADEDHPKGKPLVGECVENGQTSTPWLSLPHEIFAAGQNGLHQSYVHEVAIVKPKQEFVRL